MKFETITTKPKKTPNRFSSNDVDIAKAYIYLRLTALLDEVSYLLYLTLDLRIYVKLKSATSQA